MALLEQVKDERKIETKRERRKLLSSGQVSRRGWNIKFSVEFTAGRKTVDCNFDTLFFVSVFKVYLFTC